MQNNKEFNIQSFFKILSNYKWLIITSVVICLLSMWVYLFFKPNTYITSAIIEVKIPLEKRGDNSDPLNNLFQTTSIKVEKEIEVLKTFNINRDVIKSTNLQKKFFTKENYKYQELYKDNIPLIVTYQYLDPLLTNKLIKLTPNNNQFTLEIIYSLKEKLLSKIQNKQLLQFDKAYLFNFGTHFKTDFIEIAIDKNRNIDKPIYLKFAGDEHTLYEDIISKNLEIKQLNIHAPLIEISYTDTIPKRATEYVNHLVQTFLDKNINNKIVVNNNILEFIQEQMNKTEKKFSASGKSLEDYKSNKKLLNPTLQSDIIIKQLSEVEVKIFENRLKKKLIQNTLKVLKQGENISAIGPALVELEAKATISLIEILNKLELTENKLSQEYTNEFQELRQTRMDINDIKNKIFQNIKNLKSSILSQEHSLLQMKEEFERNLSTLPEEETKLVNLNRNHEVYSKMLAYLLEKKTENDLLKVANISDYKIIEKAYLPSSPFKPRRNLMFLLAIILGLLLGIFLSVLHYKFHKKITSIEDIELPENLNIYGYLPALKRGTKHIEAFKSSPSLYNDCLRKIRRDLELISPSSKSKVVLIASMESGEGKSSIVANLGAIFQMAQFNTILIDMNLQNPELHNYFNIPSNREGLNDYLTNRGSIENYIVSTNLPNLDIIPAGSPLYNSTELLFSSRFTQLLQELKKQYQYIIIDSTSIQHIAETVSIMKQADINLIVLRQNYSKRFILPNLEKVIKKYKIDNVGLILNEFDIDDNCI